MTIAEAMAEVVREYAEETGLDPYEICVYQGAFGMLHLAYARATTKRGCIRNHPLNKLDSVMAAVRRSDLFYRHGTIRAMDRLGGTREVPYAVYKLKR